jgi:energy-coupling factor transport system permease protein
MRLIPTYRFRASALHSARAGIGACFCGAFVFAALFYPSPLVLLGVLAGLVLAARGAGVLAELRRGALLAVPGAIVIALINALVYREGTHVIFRGGVILGRRIDVTLEALAAGGVAALRLLVIAAAFGVYSAAVDPDQMLRLFRRVSYRSALTGSLATRLAQVLHRDAERMSEAARCRPDAPGRGRVLLAVLGRSLDRAVDVAAALEVRGYAHARLRAGRRVPWSRHDAAVAAAAAAVLLAAIAGKVFGIGEFHAYPTVSMAMGPAELAVIAAFIAGGALPFAGARARLGVAHG